MHSTAPHQSNNTCPQLRHIPYFSFTVEINSFHSLCVLFNHTLCVDAYMVVSLVSFSPVILSFNLSDFSKDIKEFEEGQLWHIYFPLTKDMKKFGEGQLWHINFPLFVYTDTSKKSYVKKILVPMLEKIDTF